jgi:hypothetical protein
MMLSEVFGFQNCPNEPRSRVDVLERLAAVLLSEGSGSADLRSFDLFALDGGLGVAFAGRALVIGTLSSVA